MYRTQILSGPSPSKPPVGLARALLIDLQQQGLSMLQRRRLAQDQTSGMPIMAAGLQNDRWHFVMHQLLLHMSTEVG